jgi:hypothetical protein
MAESERMRGNRPPVTNYKVGDGSVKDLFKYILGEDLEVKKIKPKTKQTKVTIMAGERAQSIQDNMAANMMQQDPMMMQEDDFGAVPVPPPGPVEIMPLPETGMLPEPEVELDARLQELHDQGGVMNQDQTYRMGMNPRENPVGTFAGETEMPPKLMQSPRGMYGGGKVKRKKKKKKLAKGGKVSSYNY